MIVGSMNAIRLLPLAATFLGCTAPPEAGSPEPWAAPPLEHGSSVRDGRTGERIALDELFDRLARADVVFLGETHDDETTHRLELATYEALLARREGRVVLALEFFERDVQGALDAYLAGTIDEPTFLSRARPWSNYATAYRPLIEMAKARGKPVVASNFPTPLRRTLLKDGLGALATLSPGERGQAPAEILPNTPAYWRRVDNAIRGHAGMMGPPRAADDPRLDDAQTLWDNSMGESCALALERHPGALVLHVNGGFHSEYWDGTVRQLRLRAPDAEVMTVAMEPVERPASAELSGAPRADYVAFVEARAKDVSDGALAVFTSRELKYRLALPGGTSDGRRVPLLIWLGDDGESAEESLAEWRERLGESAAVAVIEPPYRETQEDLVEGGRWYWPDTFAEDVVAVGGGIEEAWAFLLRHHAIDPARVCLAGEGTGATVVAAAAMRTDRMDVRAVAREPRRFAKVKDFPLPLPELAGQARAPAKSLRLAVAPADEAWWASEIEAYRGIGFESELVIAGADPWRRDLERENAVREALGLETRAATEQGTRRYVIAESPRARAWARRLGSRHFAETGELVAALAEPTDLAKALDTAVHPGAPLPRCPGAFGGTTVVVLPEGLEEPEIASWLALEADDPLAKESRSQRLRVATDLPGTLASILAEGRKNVLIVPAEFCADGARMRELRRQVVDFEDRMTLQWLPGLGGTSPRTPR